MSNRSAHSTSVPRPTLRQQMILGLIIVGGFWIVLNGLQAFHPNGLDAEGLAFLLVQPPLFVTLMVLAYKLGRNGWLVPLLVWIPFALLSYLLGLALEPVIYSLFPLEPPDDVPLFAPTMQVTGIWFAIAGTATHYFQRLWYP